MNYTDTQLKQALAKMLPDAVGFNIHASGICLLYWRYNSKTHQPETSILDSELLHLCWLVEESLSEEQQRNYQIYLYCLFDENWTYEELVDLCFDLSWVSIWDLSHATWQQRTIAHAKVKGVEIV